MTRALLAAVWLAALASSCRNTRERPSAPRVATAAPSTVPSSSAPRPGAAAESADVAPAAPPLVPLGADSELQSLDVPGYRAAVVSVPLGAREPRPLVVALHGNFDRPEWQCEVWRSATNAHPFILCPRGVPRRDVPKSADRWEYGSAVQTERELDAGIAALRERYGAYLADGPIVYIGFSLGAILGATIVKKAPGRYPRVVLIEGGLAGFAPASAKRFVEQGGERLLIACGQSACTQKARALLKRYEQHGLLARLVDGGKIGHTYDGAIAEGIARDWPWLVEGLAGWSSAQGKAQ